MNLSPEQIRWILIRVFVLLVSVAIHDLGSEFNTSLATISWDRSGPAGAAF